MISFSRCKTGPPSINAKTDPLVSMSGCIAAYIVVIAIRFTGTIGTPARKTILTGFKIPVAVECSVFSFRLLQEVKGLTTEERVNNIDADVPTLHSRSNGTSETEYGVFAGAVQRGAGE